MTKRKPAITGLSKPHGIVDDVVIPLAKKVIKARTKPSRNATKKMIVATKKRNAYETITKGQNPLAAGFKSNEDVAKLVGKSKYYKKNTSRKEVSSVRKKNNQSSLSAKRDAEVKAAFKKDQEKMYNKNINYLLKQKNGAIQVTDMVKAEKAAKRNRFLGD
jgi:hypothetical protein